MATEEALNLAYHGARAQDTNFNVSFCPLRLTLLGKIKQHFPDLPVMMVTAYDDNERKRRANDLGTCDFLAKPVDFGYLRTRLNQIQAP